MNETSKQIELTFRREDFEELYFTNKQESIFFNKDIKPTFITLIVFLAAFVISLFYFLMKNELIAIPIIFSILSLASLFIYIKKAIPIIKWKEQVIAFIEALAKIKKHTISLSEESLTIIQDSQTTISKWITFSKATINDESVMLFGNDNYVFPKKSMNLRDYEHLKAFISSRFQNGL
jgi:hypothetical protein